VNEKTIELVVPENKEDLFEALSLPRQKGKVNLVVGKEPNIAS
jgi:hypothetical protein